MPTNSADANIAELLEAARAANNATNIIDYIPYARYLGMAVEDDTGASDHSALRRYVLPFQEKLVGNAALPALHGGVVAGFAETAALVEVLMQTTSYTFKIQQPQTL